MPSVSDAVESASNLSNYIPTDPSLNPGLPSTEPANYQPGRDTMIRCTMPPLWAESTDSQRQFYVHGQVPQSRILSPQAVTNSGNSTVNEYVASLGTTGSGSGTTTPVTPVTPVAPVASGITGAQVTMATSIIAPGAIYMGTMATAISFQLLNISTSAPCRVQFYGSKLAQLQDASRAIDIPLPAGVSQNVLADVVLDTSPYYWGFQTRVGANADSPQTAVLYVTVTNLSSASTSVSVTLQYVPLEVIV